MGRDIKAICEIKKVSELTNLFIIVLCAGLALLFTTVLGTFDHSISEIVSIMVFVIVAGYVFLNTFLKIIVLTEEVSRGITFGMTRRKLFTYLRIVDLLEIVVLMILALALVDNVDKTLIFKIAALVYGIFMWIEGLAGNNVIRYGKIAYWVYYICFFMIMIAGPKLYYIIPAARDFRMRLIDGFTNNFYNQGYLWLVLVIFMGLGMFVNWLTFRRLSVNYNV